ncbi:MAG: carboxypeptidase-like regulatory domain-containing protein [Acidobacteriota bacterium]|nr:carboxypeptidase-like regulatory domain-containing protein [Acidobacteriota bacterium]
MKRAGIFIFVLLIGVSLFAQQRTGNIYGQVVDSQGQGLPGVNITLTGRLTAPMDTVTSAEGRFRFLSLSPARDYVLKAELTGFQTKTEEGIIVNVGANASVTLVMEVGSLEEEITVTATTSVVDTKKTAVASFVTNEVLQSLPSARDPWVIIQMAPAVQMDRENIGGSESGSQAQFTAHGNRDSLQNQWSMDGAVITDVSSADSAIYYDFDSFEEMNITVGGSDVTTQTGGISINMVTKRGGQSLSLGGRFYLTDERFQAANLTDELRAEGVRATNRIENIKDFGFNMGGPIVKDKAWYWVSYGVQDIKMFTILGTKDDTLLSGYNAKINLQLLPQNRFEFYTNIASKQKWGRSATWTTPLGVRQKDRYYFGVPIVKAQDEHMFGDNMFVSGKFVYVGGGFGMWAMFNEDSAKIGRYNVANAQWDQYQYNYLHDRPRKDLSLLGHYFNEDLLGFAHEMRFGGEVSRRSHQSMGRSYTHYYHNYNNPTFDITGDQSPDIVPGLYQVRTARYNDTRFAVDAYSFYISDTLTKGRLNVMLGLRWDLQTPYIESFSVYSNAQAADPSFRDNFTQRTADVLSKYLSPFDVPETRPDYRWNNLSPRLGLTYELPGKRRTIAKLSYGKFGDFMRTGQFNVSPLGTGGYIYYWWLDQNNDGITDYTELYWHNSLTYQPYRVFDDAGNFIGDWNNTKNIMWGGFDPLNPSQTAESALKLDKNAGSSRTQELMLTLEREISADFSASVTAHYRKFDHALWTLDYYPATGHVRSKDDYVQVGTVPNSVGGWSTGSAAGRPYYLLSGSQGATSYTYRTRNNDAYDQFYGLDFMITKRLSHGWMMNGSFSVQNQIQNFGESGYLNPTNNWALDGRPYSPYIGGSSGKISQYIFARWMAKLSGLVQLPYGFNASMTFMARDGFIIPEYFNIVDYTAPNPRDRTVTIYIEEFAKLRLPIYTNMNFRLEKMLLAGDFGKIWVMADIFNLLNNDVINRRYEKYLGTLYAYENPANNRWVDNPTNYLANEILNPRTVRLGMRFQF